MSSGNDPAMLLPELMSRLSSLGPASLRAVQRFLQQLELKTLTEEIQDDADHLLAEGKLEPEVLDAVIREHRQRHPYK